MPQHDHVPENPELLAALNERFPAKVQTAMIPEIPPPSTDVKITMNAPRFMRRITRTFGPCWTCQGRGSLFNESCTAPTTPCMRCDGTGQIVVSETEEFNV